MSNLQIQKKVQITFETVGEATELLHKCRQAKLDLSVVPESSETLKELRRLGSQIYWCRQAIKFATRDD